MNKTEIDVCCKYGLAVSLIIDEIEHLIEDVNNGCGIEEVEEKLYPIELQIDWFKKREKDFQKLLEI